MGTNLGVLSAQALGERAVQLTLKSFHTGGIASAGAGGKVLGYFDRIKQLTTLPETIPDEAKLAMKSGTIDKVENTHLGTNVWIGGVNHFIPLDRAGRRLTEPVPGITAAELKWEPPAVGQKVVAGSSLSDPSRTYVNPHDLYRATGSIEKVQNHLVNELHGIYRQEGVRRQNVETVVKAMSNLTRVVDPGDASDVLKGDYQPTSVMQALNKQLVQHGKKPVEHAPILKGVNVMPLQVQEDWLAKMNFERIRGSVMQAAATGAYSNLHGTHPIPGIAYGAEFGMTEKQKHVLPHLKGIPEYAY